MAKIFSQYAAPVCQKNHPKSLVFLSRCLQPGEYLTTIVKLYQVYKQHEIWKLSF